MSSTSPCLKMNFNRKTQCDSQGSIENIPPTTKADTLPIQRGKQRTVLSVLSEYEQRGRSLSQASRCSKHSSTADRSHIKLHSGPSTSSFDVYVEEACEVVLTASGDEVFPGSCPLDIEHFALQNQDARILLELNSSSCQDNSVQSDPFLMSEGVPCMNEYAKDIHQHLRESEMRFRPKPGYLENHPELTSYMRVILVDWMVEVVREYKLQSETLHLAVNYVDRFLSRTANVKRDMLQLVGTAALMIAAKYEEIFPPDMDEFVYTTDRTYTRVQLTNMELLLLKVLGYRMAPPTINQFLSLFVSIQSVCATTENLALYVAELCLLEIDVILRYTPSVVAAAAYSLASYTVKDSLWPEILQDFSGYTMADILPCIIDLHKLYISAETHPQQAIREKYKLSKYYCVSLIPPPAIVLFT